MIEPTVQTRNDALIRWLILLLGIIVLGSNGCSLHPRHWLASNDPIVFSNARWRSPAEKINGRFADDQTRARAEPELASYQGPDKARLADTDQETIGHDRVTDRSGRENIFSPTDTAANHATTFPASSRRETPSWFEVLRTDQLNFYCRQNLRPSLRTLGAAAILANTTMDQEFADWYQDDVRSSSLDEIADVSKLFGEQWKMVAAYVGASIGGRFVGEDTRLALWGDRSLRSMFVGVPPLLLFQKALGSSRPNEGPSSSNWDFWADENGVSGHTFVGAVPFLVAAELTEDRRAKATWMALSTVPGWSRINDDDHYLSQVIVGWWLAYAATQSVERSDVSLNYEIAPVVFGNSAGVEVIWRR